MSAPRAWSEATGLELPDGDSCAWELLGPDRALALGETDLRAQLAAWGHPPPSGWTRQLCLVAPIPKQATPDIPTPKIPDEPGLDAVFDVAAASDRAGLIGMLQDRSLAVRREAALALTLLGEPVRVAGWTEGPFLERAAAHPWGAALVEGRPDPALAALLALTVDQGIQPRVLLTLATLEQLHPTFQAFATDAAARLPLALRRWAAAALLLGGGVPDDPVLHRCLLATVPGEETDLIAIAVGDPDAEVRIAAIEALKLAGAWPQRSLRRLALTDPDPRVRALLPQPADDPLAATLVVDPRDPDGRGAGLRALEADHPELAAELARALIQDADPELALAAAEVVGRHTPVAQVHGQVERTLPLLGYADWARRRLGIALLGNLALSGDLHEEVAEMIGELARHDPDPDVQQTARKVLDRWGYEG